MKNKRFLAGICAATLAVCVTGCGKDQGGGTVQSRTDLGDSYPLKTEEKLSFWTTNPLHPDYQKPADQPFFKAWMEKTGVKVDFKLGQTSEAFNLMLASGDLADIVMYSWYGLPGGPEKYIQDKTILELNGLIESDSPNLAAYLEEHPEIDKQIKTDSGKYYVYPDIKEDDKLCTFYGPAVRADLLNKFHLEEPETIEDWHTMLTVFKQNGIKTPLSFESGGHNVFASAFGVMQDFYIDDGGKVVYGPAQPGWKQYLETMMQWYEEGLIDADFGALDRDTINGKMVGGNVGASAGYLSGDLGTWLGSGRAVNPEFNISGVKYPVLNRGDKPQLSVKQNNYDGKAYFSAAITTNCKNPELAARFLDYGYTEEGQMLFNFGIEGESYQMTDGYPKFTEAVTNTQNSDLSMNMLKYMFKVSGSPSITDPRMYEQRIPYEEQKDALEKWAFSDIDKHLIPPILYNGEESQIDSECWSNIQTLTEEMTYKFILGKRPVSEFDDYVKSLNDAGLTRLIQAKQNALERYKNR